MTNAPRRKVPQIKREVFIACPVCYTGNCFQLGWAEADFKCNGCGFVLASEPGPNNSESEECIFCGSRYFYFEWLLEFFFLGRASICYVCEARYKGVVIGDPDESSNQEGSRRACRSDAASRWKGRAEEHERQTKS
jgi:hypothetical protein